MRFKLISGCLLLLALMITSDSTASTAQRFEPRIAFASNRDGDWDIYSMDVNGNNLAQLTDHPESDLNIPLARRMGEGLRSHQNVALHLICM